MKCGFPTYAVRTLHPEWTWLDLSRKSLDPCTWSLFGEPCTWLLLHNCYDSVTTLWGLENLSPFHVRFEPSENWMCNVVSQSLLQRRRIFAGWNWGPWLKIPHQWTHKWSFCGPWTIQSWRLKIAVFWSKNKGIVSNPQKTPEIVRGSPGLIICHPSKTIPQIFPGIGSKIWQRILVGKRWFPLSDSIIFPGSALPWSTWSSRIFDIQNIPKWSSTHPIPHPPIPTFPRTMQCHGEVRRLRVKPGSSQTPNTKNGILCTMESISTWIKMDQDGSSWLLFINKCHDLLRKWQRTRGFGIRREHTHLFYHRVWNVSFGQNSKLCRFPSRRCPFSFKQGCLHETADGPKANNMNSKDMCSQKHVRMKSKIKVVPVCRKWDKKMKTTTERKEQREWESEREREREEKYIERQRNKTNMFTQRAVYTRNLSHNKDPFTQQRPFWKKTPVQPLTQETPTTKTFYIKTPLHTASVCPLQQWDHPTEVGMVQNSRPWRPKMLVIFRMSEYPS